MGARAILAIARNNFRQISHDKRTLGMIVMMPIIFILLFGFTFAGEPENIRTILVNADQGAEVTFHIGGVNSTQTVTASDFFIENLDPKTFNLVYKDDLNVSLNEVKDGKAWAVIYFPPHFTQGILNWASVLGNLSEFLDADVSFNAVPVEDSNITLYVDGSNTQVAAKVIAEVGFAFTQTIEERSPNISFTSFITKDFVYGENVRFIDFFAPGIIGLVVTMITVILTIVSFVRERTNGTLDRLFVSPIKPSDIVLGYTVTFSVIALFQSVELLLVASLLFNITFVGSILLALALIVLYAIGILGLGILLSTLAKNEFQAIQFVPLVIVPSIMLAGILWPVEAMPEVVRPISSVIPLTYLASSLRSVMIRGWGLGEILPELTILIVFAVILLGVGILLVYKKANRLGLRKRKKD